MSIALAALDAVLSPEWQYRYFSFDPAWSTDARMASMRNGSGDEYFIVFAPAGAVVRAFDHESELSPWMRDDQAVAAEVLQGYPAGLRFVIDDPAFRTEGGPATDLTFCAWSTTGAEGWRVGAIDDDGGAEELLEVILDGTPRGYQAFAVDYFELDPTVEVVEAFFAHRPADASVIERMNPDANVSETISELRSIGYPVEAQQNPPRPS